MRFATTRTDSTTKIPGYTVVTVVLDSDEEAYLRESLISISEGYDLSASEYFHPASDFINHIISQLKH